MKDYPIYIIDWLDHTGDAGWSTEHEVSNQTPVTARTIGYKIHENKQSIKLADTLTDDDGVGGVTLILKSTIVSKWECNE